MIVEKVDRNGSKENKIIIHLTGKTEFCRKVRLQLHEKGSWKEAQAEKTIPPVKH